MKNIIQLKISLDHVKHKIWRRIQTPSNIKMEQLHNVIQCSMDWKNCSFYDFKVGNYPIARNTSLENILPIIQNSFQYEHGEQKWKMNIVVEEKLPINQIFLYSICLDGEGNFQLEGRVNVHTYINSGEIVKNSVNQYPRPAEKLGSYKEPKFDKKEVNDRLKKLYIDEMNK